MSFQIIVTADNRPDGFWRAADHPDDAPVTQPSSLEGLQSHASDKPTESGKTSRPPMKGTVKLAINSQLELMGTVEAIIESLTGKIGFDEDEARWIELAVHEAVTNAITHGNHYSADKRVDIQFLIEPDALTIDVRDRGECFDLTRLPDPLNPENLLNLTGRGVFWMRTFMDEVEYSIHPDGGCVVRLRKYKDSFKK